MCPGYWHAHPSHPGWLHPSSCLSIWQDEKHQPQNDYATSMMFYQKNLKKFPWHDHWEPPQTEHVTAPAGPLTPQKTVGLIKAESRSELRASSYFNRSPRVGWFEAIYWANYEKKNKRSNPTQLCIHPDGRFFFWRPVQCGVSALPLHCLAPLLFACLHN